MGYKREIKLLEKELDKHRMDLHQSMLKKGSKSEDQENLRKKIILKMNILEILKEAGK